MIGLSFFKRSTRGASGVIRANQIADYLGARVNPESAFEDDVCIYVKSTPEEYGHPVTERCYIDMVDHSFVIPWAKKHPEVNIIASTEVAKRFVQNQTPNKVIVIPQHHCNFARERRRDRSVRTAGLIGANASYELDRKQLASLLAPMRIKLFDCGDPIRHGHVVEFYKQIDVQIMFRMAKSARSESGKVLTCLKVCNASSFGIPTVSFPEEAMREEFDGCFVPVFSLRNILSAVWQLKKDKHHYQKLSEEGIDRAESYHIENIAELYRQLLKED